MRTRRVTPVALLCTTLLLGGSRATAVGAPPAMVTLGAVSVHDVRVTHDKYTAHVQPSIAVNPKAPENLLATGLFFRSPHGPRVGTFASFDGGRIWRNNGPLPLVRGTDSSDVPSVAFDAHGRGFVVGTAVNTAELDVGSDQHTCVCLWRSENGGRTFGPPTAVARGQAVDHPWIAVAPTQGTIYVVWRSKRPDGIAFSRSVDGGHRFSTARIIARVPNGGAYVPMAAAGPGGSIFVVYDGQANLHVGKGSPHTSQHLARVEVVGSTDGGVHFTPPQQLATAPELLTPIRNLTVLTAPAIAVDPKGRKVYVAYAGSATDILVTRSLDGSRTWRAPVRVSKASHSRSTALFQPAIALDSAGGVNVSYFMLTGGRIASWLARSADHGNSFGYSRRVTTRSFNPALGLRQGGATGPWWIGDYQGLAAGGELIHPVWSDTRTGHLEIFTAAIPVR